MLLYFSLITTFYYLSKCNVSEWIVEICMETYKFNKI